MARVKADTLQAVLNHQVRSIETNVIYAVATKR